MISVGLDFDQGVTASLPTPGWTPPPTLNPACAPQLTTSSGGTTFASSHPGYTSRNFPSFSRETVKRDLARPANRGIALERGWSHHATMEPMNTTALYTADRC
jgi:hypothetical protein